MFRRLAILCGMIFLLSVTAHAQDSDKVELYGGYAFLHVDTSPSFNQNGWEASGQYKFASWLGAVADFSGDYGSHSATTYYLFGPQVSWPARVSPFGHILFGGVHASSSIPGVASISDNSFAVAVGGGIDAKIFGPVNWRVFQGDWIHSTVFGGTQNNARVSTGIVIKF
jgi:hypothetical protein